VSFLLNAKKGKEPKNDKIKQEFVADIYPYLAKEFISKQDFIFILSKVLEIIDPDNEHGIDLYTNFGSKIREEELKSEL